MSTFDQHREQLMQDPDFARAVREAEAELDLAMQAAALREARGMSQAQLATAAGMRQPAVARLERAGRTPTLTTLWRLASALNARIVIGPEYQVYIEPCESTRQAAPLKERSA